VLLWLSGRVVNQACSEWKGAGGKPEDVEATDKLGVHTEGASKTKGSEEKWDVVSIELAWCLGATTGAGYSVNTVEEGRVGLLDLRGRDITKLLTKFESLYICIPVAELDWIAEAGKWVLPKQGHSLLQSCSVKLEL